MDNFKPIEELDTIHALQLLKSQIDMAIEVLKNGPTFPLSEAEKEKRKNQGILFDIGDFRISKRWHIKC